MSRLACAPAGGNAERPEGGIGAPDSDGSAAAPADRERWLRFRECYLPHVEALFHDAFCLTGHEGVAADLVVETYTHAYHTCEARQGARRAAALGRLRRTMRRLFCEYCLGSPLGETGPLATEE